MSAVENTSERDPLTHLIGAVGEGVTGYIEGMEAAGGQTLVSSTLMPTDSPWEEFEALGFVKGKPVAGDDLFMNAEMPAGWTRELASDDPRGSYVLDERGVRRIMVFYKAAFYDRRAESWLINVGHSVATEAIYGDGEVILPTYWDVLTEDEKNVARNSATKYTADAADYPSIYGKRLPRAERFLELAG